MVISYSDTNIPTAAEIRRKWCLGLPLYSSKGEAMTDSDIESFIELGINEVERHLGVFLKPTRIVTHSQGLIQGVDFDKEDGPYDYRRRDFNAWGFIQLKNRPVISVLELKLINTQGQPILDILEHTGWLKLNKATGQLRIVPTIGDPVIFQSVGTTAVGLLSGNLGRDIPAAWQIAYEAGYNIDSIPEAVRCVVAKIAAVEVLTIAGDALVSGISNVSTSIDGLSQSYGTTVSASSSLYSARINQYKADIEAAFDPLRGSLRNKEHGITLSFL